MPPTPRSMHPNMLSFPDLWGSSTHGFILDNFPVLIFVLLGCCPLRCRVAKLVPHFTINTLRVALYMLSLGLRGRTQRRARAVQLFGRLAVLETHTLRY